MAAAAGSLFRLLLVASLVLSHLVLSSNAVPVKGIGSLAHGAHRVHRIAVKGDHLKVAERMAAQLNDYPGSGANNRHTPRPQFGRD